VTLSEMTDQHGLTGVREAFGMRGRSGSERTEIRLIAEVFGSSVVILTPLENSPVWRQTSSIEMPTCAMTGDT
jgi:hypothetical protein